MRNIFALALFIFNYATLSKEFIVKKDGLIQIQNSNGDKTYLKKGDIFAVKEVDGWKQVIEIIKSNNYSGPKEVFVGKKTFIDLEEEGRAFSVTSMSVDYNAQKSEEDLKALDELVMKLTLEAKEREKKELEEITLAKRINELTELIAKEEQFLRESKELLERCPDEGKYIRVDNSIQILKKKSFKDFIPSGSVLRMISKNKRKCTLEIISLPEESKFSISDFPKEVESYASNFEDNYSEVEDPSSKINLEKGVKFKLMDGIVVDAIGRKTGKHYEFSSKDEIEIVGRHKNGSYIVKRNGEKYEYRISQIGLNRLNDDGFLDFNYEETSAQLATSIKRDVDQKVLADYNCRDFIEEEAEGDSEIAFEKCRKKKVKNKSGKVYPSNDYLENSTAMSSSGANQKLENPEIKRLSRCVSKSLQRGTRRNTNPSCTKKKVRVRSARYKKDSNTGEKKFAGWVLNNRVPRACASKGLSVSIATSFYNASKCLKLNPDETFPIFNHESHFQPNTVSPTFALGIGQIIPSNYLDFYESLATAKRFIKENGASFQKAQKFKTNSGYRKFEESKKSLNRYTTFMMSDLHRQLTDNSVKECKGLHKMYVNNFIIPKRIIKQGEAYSSSYLRDHERKRICPPNGIDESLFIGMIYYKKNKKYSKYLLEKHDAKISKSKAERFSIILSRWMYNGGVTGMKGVLKALVDKIRKNQLPPFKKLSDLTESQFKKEIAKLTLTDYPSRSKTRRKEVAKYVPGIDGRGGIDGDLKVTNKNISEGEKCGN